MEIMEKSDYFTPRMPLVLTHSFMIIHYLFTTIAMYIIYPTSIINVGQVTQGEIFGINFTEAGNVKIDRKTR